MEYYVCVEILDRRSRVSRRSVNYGDDSLSERKWMKKYVDVLFDDENNVSVRQEQEDADENVMFHFYIIIMYCGVICV
jgi:hypothetical protein